jgi:hypothetical protein
MWPVVCEEDDATTGAGICWEFCDPSRSRIGRSLGMVWLESGTVHREGPEAEQKDIYPETTNSGRAYGLNT